MARRSFRAGHEDDKLLPLTALSIRLSFASMVESFQQERNESTMKT